MEKISVIVPFYNSRKTIGRCIESILAQTYPEFEVLLVNDGSKDDTRKIVEQYMGKDSRLKMIDKEHAGVSAARNRGLEEASGDYIQFVDSDDYIERTMFETMLDVMHRENADIVLCNYTHPCIKNYLGDCVLDMEKFADRLRIYQNTFSLVVPWNKLYKRSVITDFFDEEVDFTEDELFGLANMCNARKIVSISEELYHYYAAPSDAAEEELSCISRIARADDFWKTKRTYWYMRTALMPKVAKILEQHFHAEEYNDFQYTRVFDFMLWELIIFYSLGADREGILREMQAIFGEREFVQSVNIRQKYGIRFKNFSEKERRQLVESFVRDCMAAYDDLTIHNKSERPFFVCLGIFVQYFVEQCGPADCTDIVAEMFVCLKNNSTPEAVYVNTLFEEDREAALEKCAI